MITRATAIAVTQAFAETVIERMQNAGALDLEFKLIKSFPRETDETDNRLVNYIFFNHPKDYRPGAAYSIILTETNIKYEDVYYKIQAHGQVPISGAEKLDSFRKIVKNLIEDAVNAEIIENLNISSGRQTVDYYTDAQFFVDYFAPTNYDVYVSDALDEF